MTEAEKSILATVIWFDLFDYPLTLMEVWKWRIRTSTNNESVAFSPKASPRSVYLRIRDVQQIFSESPVLKQLVGSKNGLYFLKSREGVVKTRAERSKIALRKLKKARRFAKLLAVVPFIRAIVICNTLGWRNAKDSSDIDFFIIAHRGRIFTARFFSVLLAEILGLRPRTSHTRDKICLSFFASDERINLQDIQEPALASSWPYDIYLHFWPLQLTLLYNERQTYENFLGRIEWIKKILPSATPSAPSGSVLVGLSFFIRICKRLKEMFLLSSVGRLFERWAEGFQRKKLPPALKEKVGKGTAVMLSPSFLKFHENDRRIFFHDAFVQKYHNVMRIYESHANQRIAN